MKHLKGSCLCGEIEIEVEDRFGFIGNCHCSECRKWSGAAYASGGSVTPDAFRVSKGENVLRRYRKSPSTELVFCKQCGSSLFSWKPRLDIYIIRLGILDNAPSQKPALHIYAGSKAAWHEITDELPTFETSP